MAGSKTRERKRKMQEAKALTEGSPEALREKNDSEELAEENDYEELSEESDSEELSEESNSEELSVSEMSNYQILTERNAVGNYHNRHYWRFTGQRIDCIDRQLLDDLLPADPSDRRKDKNTTINRGCFNETTRSGTMKLFRKPEKYKKKLMEHIEKLKVALISLRNLAFRITKQPGPPLIKTQNLRTRMESKDEINYRENYITTKLRQKSV